MLYVAAEYDENDLSKVKRLKLVLTAALDEKMGLATGQTISIGRKAYALGRREVLAPDDIVHYDLTPAR